MGIMTGLHPDVYNQIAACEVKRARVLCTTFGSWPIDDLDSPRGSGWYLIETTTEEIHNPAFPEAYIQEEIYVKWKTLLGCSVNVVGDMLTTFPD